MGKLKLATNLLKLNHKLGLFDLADIASLAGTAYKVSNFSPRDYVDDFDIDMILHKEEYERVQRRKTAIIAGTAAAVAYLAYANRHSLKEAADSAASKSKELAADVADKGTIALKKGEKLADEAFDKGENTGKAVETTEHKKSFYSENY